MKYWLIVAAIAVPFIALSVVSPVNASDDRPVPKIVQDSLQQNGNSYIVKGSVYNPSEKGMKNVIIKYYVWKKLMGSDGYGSRIKETGGLVVARIKYLPPKQIVDFVAGGPNAPVELNVLPDPLEDAEIAAEWD